MEPTSTQALQRFLVSPRAWRRDDEEHDVPPRWLRSRLHAELALADAVRERLALDPAARAEGGK